MCVTFDLSARQEVCLSQPLSLPHLCLLNISFFSVHIKTNWRIFIELCIVASKV